MTGGAKDSPRDRRLGWIEFPIRKQHQNLSGVHAPRIVEVVVARQWAPPPTDRESVGYSRPGGEGRWKSEIRIARSVRDYGP